MKHLDAAFVDAVFEIGSWIIKFGKTSYRNLQLLYDNIFCGLRR